MAQLPPRTYLYFCAQSINLTAAVMSVTMAALVGAQLAPTPALATTAYGLQFLLLMLSTYPAAKIMARWGRKAGFLIGAWPLAGAGALGYWAVVDRSFLLLLLSHAALGVYIAFANFNRFAATDTLDPALKPKALSLVVAGGVIAAVAGPTLTGMLSAPPGYAPFSLCYAAFGALAALAMGVALLLPNERHSAPTPASPALNPRAPRAAPTPWAPIMLATAVAALSYGIMNLLMVQASLHMAHQQAPFPAIRLAIQWHVIAMFAPSFFTGALIAKIGLRATLCAGLTLLLGCAVVNLAAYHYTTMVTSLVLLGLGWNLTYVGGGALLSQVLGHHPQAYAVQGKSDVAIAVCATLGAFSPSLLLSAVGWGGTLTGCIVMCGALLAVTLFTLGNKAGH